MKFVITVVLLLGMVAPVKAEQRNQKTTGNQTKTQKYQSGTEQRPVFVKIIPTQKGAEESKAEKEERDKNILNDKIITWSTLFLAVVTAILAAFTAFLWNATRKLVVGANETTERQLRAYINISQGKVLNFIDPQNRIFRIMFQNFGQTPAHSVSVVTECIIREYPLVDTPPLKKFTDDDHAVFSVLGPSCTYWQDVPAPVNPPEWEQRIIAGTAAVYCHGEIRYIDAFNKIRTTEFRYMAREDGTSEGNVTPCKDGNNAT